MYGIDTKKEFKFILKNSNWMKFNDYYIQKLNATVKDHENIITGYTYGNNEIENNLLKKEISKIFEIGTIEGFIVYKAYSILNLDIESLIGVL